MQATLRRIPALVAIYVIALHTMLWGVASPFAATANDPFAVICHSTPQTAGDQSPQAPANAPAYACGHCSLCSATPPAPVALDSIVATQFIPARLLHVLRPQSTTSRDGIAANPNRARGPPVFA